MTAKEKVMAYVNSVFELDKDYGDGLRVEDFPMLPGGTKVLDNEGEILYFYDVLKDEIVEQQNGEETRIPLFTITKNDPKGYYPGGL